MNQNAVAQELEQLQGVYLLITEFLVQYSFKILGTVIIFLLDLWIAGKIATLIAKQFAKHNTDISLSNFIRILIIITVGITALGKLGISITPMVAAIAHSISSACNRPTRYQLKPSSTHCSHYN